MSTSSRRVRTSSPAPPPLDRGTTSGCAWPSSIGPQEPIGRRTRARRVGEVRPRAEVMTAASADSAEGPHGELTPPLVTALALANMRSEAGAGTDGSPRILSNAPVGGPAGGASRSQSLLPRRPGKAMMTSGVRGAAAWDAMAGTGSPRRDLSSTQARRHTCCGHGVSGTHRSILGGPPAREVAGDRRQLLGRWYRAGGLPSSTPPRLEATAGALTSGSRSGRGCCCCRHARQRRARDAAPVPGRTPRCVAGGQGRGRGAALSSSLSPHDAAHAVRWPSTSRLECGLLSRSRLVQRPGGLSSGSSHSGTRSP